MLFQSKEKELIRVCKEVVISFWLLPSDERSARVEQEL